jgi:CDGSH-type Zn-finger protein
MNQTEDNTAIVQRFDDELRHRDVSTLEPSKKKNCKVVVVKNGPYLVSGNLPLAKESIVSDSEGYPVEWSSGDHYPDQENYALCRCGQSENKPYCDGIHAKIDFDGTETASRKKYLEQAEKTSGPDLVLADARELCVHAGFCDRAGGIWELTKDSDDLKSKGIAIQEAGNCPSGRLVIWDKKTGKPIEPQLEPSISLVEPGKGVSGPIWVKGGVPLESSDGTQYETRNRVTLCRCGKSGNKPFCDGSHISMGFTDGDESLSK